MDEVQYRSEVAKCPRGDCQNAVQISVGRWPGGVHDYGGWILKCTRCGQVFPLKVKNPDGPSRVASGATVLANWDDEKGDRAEAFAAHGISDEAEEAERLVLFQHGEPETLFDLASRPLYRCGACGESMEELSYAVLQEHIAVVNQAIGGFAIWHLAHRDAAPEATIVIQEVICHCGANHRARFYQPFSEKSSQTASDYWLVDVTGARATLDVDGIYSRDDCIAILEKLLLRWRALHNTVLLAAPFIGFNYPGARKKVPELWNWVLKYTDPSKTSLITRKATFKLLKDVSKDSEQDVDFLKSWGLLNPTLASLDEKKAFFKTDFHAKFYCGMSADRVEILVGSFNIHEGTYVENIHLLTYSFEEFRKRYLLGMKMFFDVAVLEEPRNILEISLDGDKVAKSKVVRHSRSITWESVSG